MSNITMDKDKFEIYLQKGQKIVSDGIAKGIDPKIILRNVKKKTQKEFLDWKATVKPID
jgi:hypothetical protein